MFSFVPLTSFCRLNQKIIIFWFFWKIANYSENILAKFRCTFGTFLRNFGQIFLKYYIFHFCFNFWNYTSPNIVWFRISSQFLRIFIEFGQIISNSWIILFLLLEFFEILDTHFGSSCDLFICKWKCLRPHSICSSGLLMIW